MSRQQYVKDTFWTDGYIARLSVKEKFLFLYLLTNPMLNIAGIYEIRIEKIVFESGLEKDDVENILDKFSKDGKILRFLDWVIIVNFIKNQAENPSVTAGIHRILKNLPENVKTFILNGFKTMRAVCLQEGTACPTLLNLTLLNLTLLNLTEESENTFLEKTKKEDINFKKPKIEEIKKYCEERKNKVVAEHFFDFYESKNWKIGKNSMKNWQACVRTWERNSGGGGEKKYITKVHDLTNLK